MPIQKPVVKWTRIVPVRFARAPDAADPNKTSGPPDANAPDPDDRGFMPVAVGGAALPVGLDPAVADAARPETRVRLIRVDLENAAALYVGSDKADMIDITMPAGNAALPSQQNMMIKFKAKKEGTCFLEAHFGDANGPVIGRLQMRISRVRKLQVKAHAPVVNGAAINDSSGNAVPSQSTYKTVAQINARLDDVNAIYLPYGLKFELNGAVDTSAVNFASQGAVDLQYVWNGATNSWDSEFTTITAHNREEHGVINIIFVPQIIDNTPASVSGPDSVGGVASSARNNPTTFGLLLADWAKEGQTVAHELGHILNLVNDPPPAVPPAGYKQFIHVNAKDKMTNPDMPGTGVNVRDDIVSRRRLMWAYTELLNESQRDFTFLGPPNLYNYENIMPYRKDVGYGNNKVGVMLTIKQFDADKTDRELEEVQASATWLLSRP